LQFKKAQGMKLGRPKGVGKSKLDAFKPEIESLLANGLNPEIYRPTLQNH